MLALGSSEGHKHRTGATRLTVRGLPGILVSEKKSNRLLAARRRELLERAAQDCEALGTRALAVPTDVTDADEVRALASAAASAFGGIDAWVNNAGTSMWGRFEEIPLRSQARLIELNLLGAMAGCHAVLPHFFERGGRGVIVNVSSIGGRVPMPFATSYSASKFSLAGFSDALRSELAAHSSIEVCCVYPAYVDTPTYLESANHTGRALRPVPPVVGPERVAERIVGLVLRPRRSARVGAANAIAVPFALLSDWTGRLVSRLAERFLLRSGPEADPTNGGLWETVRTTGGPVARGGWGAEARSRARRATTVALAGLAGVTSAVLLSRRARRASSRS